MFRHFDLMQVMTAGGPAGATEVLTTLVYKQSFQFFRNEYASAIAILMFLVMFCFSLGYVRLIRGREPGDDKGGDTASQDIAKLVSYPNLDGNT